MNHSPEYYTSRPNLLRVAQEIAAMEHPERAVEALGAVLADSPEKEPPATPGGQTNNERFNVLLNSCQDHRAIYNALWAFAEAGEKVAVWRI